LEVVVDRPARRALKPALATHAGFDLVHVEHTQLARLLPRDRRNTWALTMQQLISRRFEHQANVARRARHRWLAEQEQRKARALERWASSHYDLVTVASEEQGVLAVVGGFRGSEAGAICGVNVIDV